MDRHVALRQAQGPELVERAALLAMTGMDSLIITQRLGIRSSSRNDKAVVAEVGDTETWFKPTKHRYRRASAS